MPTVHRFRLTIVSILAAFAALVAIVPVAQAGTYTVAVRCSNPDIQGQNPADVPAVGWYAVDARAPGWSTRAFSDTSDGLFTNGQVNHSAPDYCNTPVEQVEASNNPYKVADGGGPGTAGWAFYAPGANKYRSPLTDGAVQIAPDAPFSSTASLDRVRYRSLAMRRLSDDGTSAYSYGVQLAAITQDAPATASRCDGGAGDAPTFAGLALDPTLANCHQLIGCYGSQLGQEPGWPGTPGTIDTADADPAHSKCAVQPTGTGAKVYSAVADSPAAGQDYSDGYYQLAMPAGAGARGFLARVTCGYFNGGNCLADQVHPRTYVKLDIGETLFDVTENTPPEITSFTPPSDTWINAATPPTSSYQVAFDTRDLVGVHDYTLDLATIHQDKTNPACPNDEVGQTIESYAPCTSPTMLAAGDHGRIVSDSFTYTASQLPTDGIYTGTATFTDSLENADQRTFGVRVDRTPPTAHFTPVQGCQVTYDNLADNLSGVNGAPSHIDYSTDNGATWHPLPTGYDTSSSTLTASLPSSECSRSLRLRAVVYDIAGNSSITPGQNTPPAPPAPPVAVPPSTPVPVIVGVPTPTPTPVAPRPAPAPTPRTKLSLTKRASARSVRRGGRIYFTMRVTNRGAHTARNVIVCDQLPGVVGAVTNARPAMVVMFGQACAKVGNLSAHHSRTLRLYVRIDRGARLGRATNHARATASNAPPVHASTTFRVLAPRHPPKRLTSHVTG